MLNFRDLPDRSVVDEEGILPRIHVIHIKAIDLPLVEKERQGLADAVLMQNVRKREGMDFCALQILRVSTLPIGSSL